MDWLHHRGYDMGLMCEQDFRFERCLGGQGLAAEVTTGEGIRRTSAVEHDTIYDERSATRYELD